MKPLHFLKKILPKPSTLIGLTLDQTALRLVELQKVGDDYLLRHYSQTPLPVTATGENFSFAHASCVDFLKQTFQKYNITTQHVAFALPHAAALFKTIELDKNLKEMDIAIQVRRHAEQYFNYPLNELMMDFELLEDSKNHAGLREVRWMAARRSEVDVPFNALRAAGFIVDLVDIDSYTLCRVAGYALKKQLSQRAYIAMIYFYPASLLLVVSSQGRCLYARTEDYRAHPPENLAPCIESTVNQALQVYLSNHADVSLSCILFAGQIPDEEIPKKTQDKFRIPVDTLSVWFPRDLSVDTGMTRLSHEFAVNIGLAMRVMS
jgi:Tfp pilus assembly PilM family ATPase